MRSSSNRITPPDTEDLAHYARTVAGMHKALHRIFANKKAISDSLLRTAATLRTISASNAGKSSAPSIPPAC
ncbi:hypothetical protein [Quatrionicoccus australiensis]|uniref:hypothetical protein n=1 Tax=Quatrionicoccus australiensis TaxID=138118 RepID=UPI001CFABE9E|nr:hypothetical protein [Quatrionicoccus australiensis]MCB4361754.1 hypothetical protein [Quatrionicoccus australiensis]